MIAIVTAAAALLLSIISIFLDWLILKILISTLLLSAVSIALAARFAGKGKGNHSEAADSADKDLEGENRRLSSRLGEMEEKIRELSSENGRLTGHLDALVEEAAFLCSSMPLMKQLAGLVIDKTEESAMSLTENIFQISTRSSRVGSHISSFLSGLFAGEKSLKNNIEVLNGEMKRIEKLIADFTAINKRYTVDMKHIEDNVNIIKSFLDGIRDVSDRTGLLAINSSIEAARVGSAGRGFSVLAGEIQGLASSSREISLQIDEVVAGISERVEESFHTLESEIKLTLGELSQTQIDLQQISASLDSNIVEVESHVKDSDSLSKTVTEQLNNVTVNMQYQDITRQILEHIMSVLNFYRVRLEEKEPRLIAETENPEKREKILQKASSYFTIEDEWKLFGLNALFREASRADSEEEFKGNVEMF